MPQFSTQPPRDPRGHALPIVRTPAGRTLQAIVTSADMIGCPTHFYGGRTVPCELDGCKPCNEGHPWRWHAWLGAWQPTNHWHFLFEVTARVAELFTHYRDQHGSLRGCEFRAQRRGPSKNSRVFLECRPADLQKLHLPSPPDLIKCLSIIWGIRTPELDIEGVLKSVPRVVIDRTGNGRLITPAGSVDTNTNEAPPDAA